MTGSTYFPFFVHLRFVGLDNPKVTTPVDRILVGYERDDGSMQRFELSGPGMWKEFSEFVHGFSNACSRSAVPVGWQLRTLVWPAVVLNCAASGERLCHDMVMRMDGRWNDTRMVDLSNVVCQGSWDPSTRPSVDDVAAFFGIGLKDPLEILREIHRVYSEAIDRQ